MARKVKVKDIINPLLLALLITVLNHYAVYFPWLVGDQEKIVQATQYKKNIREREHQPNNLNRDSLAKQFLLIDVSNDMSVYCDSGKADSMGLAVEPGSLKTSPCYSGVDIQKLAQLFKWLAYHQDQYNLIVCDILFGDLQGKQSDSLLGYMLNIVQSGTGRKIIFPGIYDKNNEHFVTSAFSVNLPVETKAAVNEELTGDHILKYRLSYENGRVRSLPLVMLETIDGCKIEPGFPGFSIYTRRNGSRTTASNLFIPEMLFSNEDIDSLRMPGNFYGMSVDSGVGRMALWQTLLKFGGTPNYYLQEVLRTSSSNKRNIFIGSFNHMNPDMHKTLYGDMDGSLILLNVYYNLLLNENKLDLGYNLFIFAFSCLIALLILHPLHNRRRIRPLVLRLIIDFLLEEIHNILLILMTLFSSILFDKTSNVIVLLGGILLVNRIIKTYRKDKPAPSLQGGVGHGHAESGSA